MFEWIIKQKRKIIIILIILLVGVPFIVHCLFKINSGDSFWVSAWTAGEFLAYYGSMLSFVSTIILSILVLWQNEMIRNESNKHTELLEEMEKSKCCPFFSISFISEKVNHSSIEIEIQNISENIAIDIQLIEINGTLKRKNKFVEFLGNLKPQDTLRVNLGNEFLEDKEIIQMLIQCKDIYGSNRSYAVRGGFNSPKRKYLFAVCKQG